MHWENEVKEVDQVREGGEEEELAERGIEIPALTEEEEKEKVVDKTAREASSDICEYHKETDYLRFRD
jgi:hypothetical protein